jgi:L-2-hydroxyglutarate oxidase
MTLTADIAIIGGGIVGCATAHALQERDPGLKIILFEKEDRLAAHQTGHNSGVIHSGLYYKPGSLKAEMCTAGRIAMYRFCAEHEIPCEQCGKIVVAVDETELEALDELERRGRANGLDGLSRLDEAGLRKHEPYVRGLAGLHVAETGIVDYTRVTETLAKRFEEHGGTIQLKTRVAKVARDKGGYSVHVGGKRYTVKGLVNCAGLQADLVARSAGLHPDVQIIPFRGEYYELVSEQAHLIKNLIYPVPDPKMPFLGVHFTRMIDGTVEAGPNAVLALRREGYQRTDLSVLDLAEVLIYPGFWKLAARFWDIGIDEQARSFSKSRFVKSLNRLVPELRAEDLNPGGSGVRAQAVDRQGKLVDDFSLIKVGRMVHVLNAPSPAATASLSIGEHIADNVMSALE